MAPKVKQRRPISRRILLRRTTWLPRTGPRLPILITSSSRQVSRSRFISSPRRCGTILQLQRCSPSRRTSTIPITATTRMQATASRCFRHKNLHHRCRNIRSLQSPAMAIYGRPGIGATLRRATSGYRVPGRCRLKWASYGRLDIGDSRRESTASTTASGAHMSATTAALTMGSAMAASAIRAGIGAEIVSTITAP